MSRGASPCLLARAGLQFEFSDLLLVIAPQDRSLIGIGPPARAAVATLELEMLALLDDLRR